MDSTSSTRRVCTRRWDASDGDVVSGLWAWQGLAWVVMGAHYREKRADFSMHSRRRQTNGELHAELLEQTQPLEGAKGVGAAFLGLLKLVAIDGLEQLVKRVLGAPEVYLVGRSGREGNSVEKRLDGFVGIGGFAPLVGQTPEQVLQRETERGLLESDAAVFGFLEQMPNLGKIGDGESQLVEDGGLQGLLSGGFEGERKRRVQIGQKTQKGCVGVVELAQRSLNLEAGVAQKLIQNAAGIVAKQISEGKRGRAKMVVQHAQRRRQIRSLKGVEEAFLKLVEKVFSSGFGHAAHEVVIAKMKHGKTERGGFKGRRITHMGTPKFEVEPPSVPVLFATGFDVVTVEVIGRLVALEQRPDGVMGEGFFQIDLPRRNLRFPQFAARAHRRNIAFGLGENVQKIGLDGDVKGRLRKLHGAGCVQQILDGFDAGNIVKKPRTARVHEHEVPLHFQKLEDAGDLVGGKRPFGLFLQKTLFGVGAVV